MKNIVSLLLLSVVVNAVGMLMTKDAFAEVERMTRERFQDGTARRWEVKVYCVGQERPVFIRRLLSTRTWCAKLDDSLCNLDKNELARMVCSDPAALASDISEEETQASETSKPLDENTQVVEQRAPVQTPPKVTGTSTPVQLDNTANYSLVLQNMTRSDLLREQMRIDDALLRLQQSKLELRKREVELTRKLMAL